MNIREYLKTHKILADGGMGTYYGALHNGEVSEFANLDNPREVEKIHLAYLKAGANLIVTNTFAANEQSMGLSGKEVKQCIQQGVQIAKGAIEKSGREDVFLAGDIGPIQEHSECKEEDIIKQY